MGWDLALQSASAVTKGGFAYHRVSKTEFRWKKLIKQSLKRKFDMKTLVFEPFLTYVQYKLFLCPFRNFFKI